MDLGQKMLICAQACKACVAQCEKHIFSESFRCAEFCKKCMAEPERLLAKQSKSS